MKDNKCKHTRPKPHKFKCSKPDKIIHLYTENPSEDSPDKVEVVIPYKSGVLALRDDLNPEYLESLLEKAYATKKDIEDVINNIEELKRGVVYTDKNQVVNGLKTFNTPPKSNKPAKEDDDLVRYDQIKDLPTDKLADFYYSNPEGMPDEVGGLVAGTTFDNVPLKDLLDGLLYKYMEPMVSLMTLSTTEMPAYKYLPTITLNYAFSNTQNIEEKTLEVYVNKQQYLKEQPVKQNVTINAALGLDYYSINATTLPVEVRCRSIKNTVISKTMNIQFTLWCWTGCSEKNDITTEDDILSTINDEGFSIKYTNNLKQQFDFKAGGYKYIIYPSSWGIPTKFIDTDTQFEVPMDDLGEVNFEYSPGGADGVNPVSNLKYKVYRSHQLLGGAVKIKIT